VFTTQATYTKGSGFTSTLRGGEGAPGSFVLQLLNDDSIFTNSLPLLTGFV
jgi:hypothetical protein